MDDRATSTTALHTTTLVSERKSLPDQLTSSQHFGPASDVSGSDNDDNFKTGDPIDDITLTKRQIDNVSGVH